MIERIVFDCETDGLLDSFKTGVYTTATKVWCLCAYDVTGKEMHTFDVERGNILEGLELLSRAREVIGHNIINFDFRVFQRLYGFTYTGLVVDTYILSEYLYPERSGGHNLEAWGVRTGRSKPEHEDWSQFSPEMLHRCTEDVEINYLTYQMLMKEARQPIKGVQLWA